MLTLGCCSTPLTTSNRSIVVPPGPTSSMLIRALVSELPARMFRAPAAAAGPAVHASAETASATVSTALPLNDIPVTFPPYRIQPSKVLLGLKTR